MSDFKGQVYIVCFDKPYLNKTTGQKCMHYIGFSNFLGLRMAHHRNGTGSSFLKAVNQAGITYIVSRIFNHVDKEFERKLKNRRKSRLYCPRCTEKFYKVKGYLEPQRQQKRAYKIREFLDNLIVYDVIVTKQILIEKLAKRFRIGETFILNGKHYTRVNKRISKKYFDIEFEDFQPQPIEHKDLMATDKFKFQDYIRHSVKKSENQVEEKIPVLDQVYDDDYEIPF